MTNEELFVTGDFNKLYEKNQRYIYSLIKKYPNLNSEDVISCGNLGFTKAVKTYSTDKKTKFLTYASTCINNQILMFIRKDKKHKNISSLNEEIIKNNDGDSLTLEETLHSKENLEADYVHNEELEILRDIIKILPDKLRTLIELKLQGKTQREIAGKMGLAQSYISRLEGKTYKRIKELMLRKGVVEMSKKDDALKLFAENWSVEEVSKKLNLTESSARTYKTVFNKQQSEEPGKTKEDEKFKFQRAFHLFDTGFSTEEVANMLDISEKTSVNYKGMYNREQREKENKGITKRIQSFELFKQGIGSKEVAEKLGIAVSTAQTYKSEYNTINKIEEENLVLEIERKEKSKAMEEVIYSKEEVKKEERKMLKKTILFEGSLMDYKITDNGIEITPKAGATLRKDNLELFVKEILELKSVV